MACATLSLKSHDTAKSQKQGMSRTRPKAVSESKARNHIQGQTNMRSCPLLGHQSRQELLGVALEVPRSSAAWKSAKLLPANWALACAPLRPSCQHLPKQSNHLSIRVSGREPLRSSYSRSGTCTHGSAPTKRSHSKLRTPFQLAGNGRNES